MEELKAEEVPKGPEQEEARWRQMVPATVADGNNDEDSFGMEDGRNSRC